MTEDNQPKPPSWEEEIFESIDLKPMRVIIAGSRSYPGWIDGVDRAVKASGFEIAIVISGVARGADTAGGMWAYANNIPVESYSADWDKYGRKAGPIRNQQMANEADALIALWDGKSRGTRDMINRMRNKPTFVYWENDWNE